MIVSVPQCGRHNCVDESHEILDPLDSKTWISTSCHPELKSKNQAKTKNLPKFWSSEEWQKKTLREILGSGSPLRVLESYSNLQGLCFSEMKSINITAPLGMLRHWHEGPKRSSQQQISQNPKTQNELDFLDTTKNMLYHLRPWNGSQRISM